MKNSLLLITLFICCFIPAKLFANEYNLYLQLKNKNVLPFNLTIDNDNFIINNAAEKIVLNNIIKRGDSTIVSFTAYTSALVFKKITKKKVKGYWINYTKGDNYKVPFYGVKKKKVVNNIAALQKYVGKWEATFNYSKPTKLIGQFKIENNSLTGTFLSETGDFRYLQGSLKNNILHLSCFDGSHAFLFSATLLNDTLRGDFYSGIHYKTTWTAFKNENATLRHADSLTYLTNKEPISFVLKNTAGDTVRYSNQNPTDKITLIQIFGSWCPNCLDETNLLIELNEQFKDKIQIYGVGFEVEKTNEAKLARLQKFQNNLHIPYDILVGGNASKTEATSVFPMLNKVMSFPTLIIIDSHGEVQKIHTGFSGPATGEHYTTFKKDLIEFIAAMD